MNTKEQKRNADGEKSMKIRVAGHPVQLSFAKEADASIAQRVRNCLLDAYIRRNAGKT